jgi:hypothetical protein
MVKRRLPLVLVLIGMLLSSQIPLVGAQDDADYCAALQDSMARLERQALRLLEQNPVSDEITSEDIDRFLESTDTLLLLISAQTMLQETFDLFCAPILAEAESGAGEGERDATDAQPTTEPTPEANPDVGTGLLAVPIPEDLSYSGGWAIGLSSGCDPATARVERPFDSINPILVGCIQFLIDDNGRVLWTGFPVPFGGVGCQRFASFDGSTLRFRGTYEGDVEVTANIEVTGPLDGVYLPVRISGMFDAYHMNTDEFWGTGSFDFIGALERRPVSETLEAESACGTAD